MTNQAGGIGRATTWAVRGAALLPVDSPAGQAASEGRGRLRAEPGGTAAPPQGGPAAGPLRLAPDAAVVVRGSRIVRAGDHAHLSEVEAAAARGGQGDPAVAAALAQARRWDGYILPGLVDLHCHGGGGQSFPDAASAEEALVAVQEHRRHGTTSLVASLVTDAPAVLVRQSALLAELCQAGHLAGIHLEGPFLSPRRAGAQDPALMQTPSPDLVRQVAAAARGWFKVMTVAPELPGVAAPAPCGAEAVADAAPAAAGAGSGSLISALAEVGAVPSFGHTDCSAEQMGAAATAARRALAGAGAPAEFAEAGPGQTGAAAAAAPGHAAPAGPGAARPAGRLGAGVATATHLFNGMRPIHHRDPGPAMEALARAAAGELIVELVADGVHLHPRMVKDVFDLVGPAAVALVTDAMAAAGMPDGDYQLGPAAVAVRGAVARLAEGGAIAGGTAHLIDVVRCVWRASGVPLADAVAAASLTPARVLGRSGQLGALAAHCAADLILADSDLRPVEVYARGQRVAPRAG